MPLTAPTLTKPSSGEQLTDLRKSLNDKATELKKGIDEDEELKDQLMNELKALTAKLEEVMRRLGKLNKAKTEYMRTLQEVNFSLDKVEDTGVEIAGRTDELHATGRDPVAKYLDGE